MNDIMTATESRVLAPRVWSKRSAGIPAAAVYVGRPSKWGNPFVIGRDGTREEVIELYREMASQFSTAELAELRGKDLVCWCAPLPCHADVLHEVANR